jgi:hypothetical protein
MPLAASPEHVQSPGLAEALARWLRPAVGFAHPSDVLKDPDLPRDEKRAILASWASDASAVEDDPRLRWLLGTAEPVPFADVYEALARLDGGAARQ